METIVFVQVSHFFSDTSAKSAILNSYIKSFLVSGNIAVVDSRKEKVCCSCAIDIQLIQLSSMNEVGKAVHIFVSSDQHTAEVNVLSVRAELCWLAVKRFAFVHVRF